jgi:hypothetical protein
VEINTLKFGKPAVVGIVINNFVDIHVDKQMNNSRQPYEITAFFIILHR